MRAEIQGLRAIAVGMVVLFHLWPALLSGGFVGVDVFFVISGYLITSRLIQQARQGQLSLTAFWARRARRLLPAALLVLVASTLATLAWMPRGLWRQSFQEIVASAFYVQNWRLASDATDYFAAANQPSCVQHFWSLSVEEQFYFALPLLLLLGQKLSNRSWTDRRRAYLACLLAVTAASFAHCWVAAGNAPNAYFSTPVRAWEFGTGALLSFVEGAAPSRVRCLTAWFGIALCIAGAVAFDSQTVFPGPATLVPVLGAAAVIWAGDGGTRLEPAALSRLRPVLFVGDLSYPIYLWHWPLIIWAPLLLGRPLEALDKLILLFSSVLLAALTTRWIERPIRFPAAAAPEPLPRVVGAWSVAGMALVVGSAGFGLARTAAAEASSGAAISELEARHSKCFGAGALRARSRPCIDRELGDALVPQPEFARFDQVTRPDCRTTGGSLQMCTLGPETGFAKRLAALGDSHAAALLPAYEHIANAMGWRIDFAAKNACYWTSAVQSNPNAAEIAGCQQWKAELNQRLAQSEPYEAILVTHRVDAFQPEGSSAEDVQAVIVRGMLDAWGTQTARGTKIIAIRDNPTGDAGRAACVAEHLLHSNEFCALDRKLAFGIFDGHIAATRGLPGSYLVDLSDYYCDARRCFPVIGNVVVYRDDNHITATFARSLAPLLLSELRKILG